ncbi:hypothetical protein EDD11_006131 [Mortierella claussenii]|nr:hypothetical protein EDD11_006131 [Mortierella claussenii]
MKELYDAKIRRLTKMLQDAGVSPTEVENNLAVVVEETDEKQPLFDDEDDIDGITGEYHHPHLRHLVGGMVGDRVRQAAIEDSPVRYLFEEECSSILSEDERRELDDDDDDDDPLEFMSSSGTLSLLSTDTTQLTKPDDNSLSRQSLGAMRNIAAVATDVRFPITAVKAETATSKRRASGSRPFRAAPPFSSTASELSAPSCSVNARQQQHAGLSTSSFSSINPAAISKSKAKAQTHGQNQGQAQGQSQSNEGGPSHESQSPIPSFIADSLAAGTLGMKTLREKWAMASGVLSWNRPPKSDHSNSSIVINPSGHFISHEGIVSDKKPALVEASIPPPLQNGLPLLTERKDNNEQDQESWTGVVTPMSRKHCSKEQPVQAQPPRPMSDIGFLRSPAKYPVLTMPRDIPRPPITRIHDYLRRPNSYNPSPLHYRAITMAASLIDTGAITPAKLYARRTQTMIAKWTIGLIMNSRSSRSPPSSFPIIRESLSSEQEEMLGHCDHLDNNEDEMYHHHASSSSSRRESGMALEMVSNSHRASGEGSSTDFPKALSFRSHFTPPSFASSSFPHTTSLSYYQPYHIISTQSVVELSDISSPTMSMSPMFSCVGDAAGKPLTDRYGFLVNARPMAVQQGLMKLNEAHAYDDLDTPTFNRSVNGDNILSGVGAGKSSGATYEYLRTPTEELESTSERSSSPPPVVSSLYFSAHVSGASGAGASFTAAGSATTSTTTSPPTCATLPILSTAARPTSTLSPPSSSTATVTTLLSQIKVLHDSVQTTQKEKWDAFLRKRRRRVHMGETNGGALANMSSTNLGAPLFGNLMLSLEEQEQDDEDIMYWTSVCLIGIATIGKGSDWEEFRDLARGGIPVTYRNKIWQEASGALDMRQPGYYKELLSRQSLEACQCWGDIELDLHRTFPTNVLFSPGGHGIDKLKNILLAYSLHNPTVGYCQGMNLLAGTLLLTNNSEEEAFWILTSMLGRHLPEDYFTQQLLSPQADQRVLRELVQEIMPRLSMHFQEMHVDLTAVTFSWFLTLFTDCLPVETLLRVWDVFFVEGMIVVFKVAVAILWMNEKDILKCRNGAAVYCFMKQMTLSMHQADKLVKVAFVTLKSYISPEKVEAKRQRHQQGVRQELIQEQQTLKMKAFVCNNPPSLSADKKAL